MLSALCVVTYAQTSPKNFQHFYVKCVCQHQQAKVSPKRAAAARTQHILVKVKEGEQQQRDVRFECKEKSKITIVYIEVLKQDIRMAGKKKSARGTLIQQ